MVFSRLSQSCVVLNFIKMCGGPNVIPTFVCWREKSGIKAEAKPSLRPLFGFTGNISFFTESIRYVERYTGFINCASGDSQFGCNC